MSNKLYRPKNNGKRGVCQDCGKFRKVDQHHTVLFSLGGTETIDLCHACHVARHKQNGDFKVWGKIGGQKTASNPENYRRNLKQFRSA